MRRLGLPRFARIAGLTAAILLASTSPVAATDFLVLSPFDSGGGTLRQAILDANNDVAGGPHRILFNLPVPSSKTITLTSPLPSIVATVTIDGFSQPGASPNTLTVGNDANVIVEIDASNVGVFTPVLDLLGAGSTVRGLALSAPPNGIAVDLLAADMVIEGCLIGMRPDGTATPLVNGIQGLFSTDGHRIGGPLPEHRNVFAGHSNRAIILSGDNVTIQGNYIGTDPTGSVAAGQSAGGIALFFGSSNNQVGGLAPGEGNLISGISGVAIAIQGSPQPGQGNRVEGNLVGTDASGTLAIPNVGDGISVSENLGTVITGNTVANLLSNDLTLGTPAIDVVLRSQDAVVQGNRIGVGLDDSPMPNEGVGVRVAASNGALIGGFGPGEGNLIVGTYGEPGVGVAIYEVPTGPLGPGIPAVRNSILGNSIFGNEGLAVDLVVGELSSIPDGPTPNDPGDLDEGPNNLQNAPTLLAVARNAAEWQFDGELESLPNQDYEIQLYSSQACHPTGYGEGETLLGRVQVSTDAAGLATFQAAVPPPPAGHIGLAALATDADGNTSEFGPCLARGVLEIPTASTAGLLALIILLALVAIGSLRTV